MLLTFLPIDFLPNFKQAFIILYVILISTSAANAEAQSTEKCVCPPKSNLASDFTKSSMVFLGQVVEVRSQYPLHDNFYYVRFLPMKRYKGSEKYPNPENVVVYAPVPTDPCTFRFIKGNDYLVFANGNPGFLKTNSCSFTGLQEDRSQEIIELNNLKNK